MPASNRESGAGRSDILSRPDAAHAQSLPAIVIEVKRPRHKDTSRSDFGPDELSVHATEVALAQALDRAYGHGVEANGRLVWGVSFSGKLVRTACMRLA